MQKRVVYEGLIRVVGRRKISAFLENLARPHVVSDDLAAGYRAMAEDAAREQEAQAWSRSARWASVVASWTCTQMAGGPSIIAHPFPGPS